MIFQPSSMSPPQCNCGGTEAQIAGRPTAVQLRENQKHKLRGNMKGDVWNAKLSWKTGNESHI